MSAKPSEAKTEAKVDEVTDQLASLNNDEAAKKKADKKARQKAKKAAEKGSEEKPAVEKTEKTEKEAPKNKKKQNKSKSGGGDKGPKSQTDPPSVAIADLFPNGNFPEGQIMEHPIANDDSKAKDRFSSEEARAIDRANIDMYNEVR